ncbi:MAG: MBL fold metallo-hydrolase [Arenicellaceae bacterium]|nr:MBL fold metallo-hydrolase [Arenicellaceae bacterium]
MKTNNIVAIGLVGFILTVACSGVNSQSTDAEALPSTQSTPYPSDLLVRVRGVAMAIPGELATAVNFAKVAESHRTYAGIIEGGADELFVSARTAFQIVYPKGSIMLDSGMDEEVHRYYGFGRDEPYWQEANDRVQQALKNAQLIIITHEHGDHVAGVIRSDIRDQLASKTILTQQQVDTLISAPQLPQIQLTEQQASDYIVVDYEQIMPIAPGTVLIKSPGHTQGHQMLYLQLANGEELLFIGDIGWSLDNITQLMLRPEATMARIKENPVALTHQMIWIKQIMDEDGIIVVPSHDDRLLTRYVEDGKLGKF